MTAFSYHSARRFLLTSAVLTVTVVTSAARAGDVSFTREVIPILTKAGCNSGACHGSFQGRGGFTLSLFGFNPTADYDAIVRGSRGRRALPAAPEGSLLLLKPTAAVPHGGGRRLRKDEEGYQLIREWIARGVPAPRDDDPQVTRLEVTPAEVTSKADEQIALRVRATWSDGVAQDAARWTLYESTNDQVASVSPRGEVRTHRPGRTVITARYLGQVAAVTVTVPYGAPAETTAFTPNNFVDELVAAEWRKVGLRPAPTADDAEFLRRVSLDLTGTLPTPDEVRAFLKDTAADKRAKLIDALLERPEYGDYWALKWADLLRGHRRALGAKGLVSFNGWLRKAIRENRSTDRIVRELLTAQGNLYTNGAVAFYFVDQTPQDLAETTAQVFLGVRLQCAKCHHHPFEVWTQDDYYGLSACFARVERKDTKEGGRYGGSQSVRVALTGEVIHPVTNLPAPPRTLGGKPLRIPDGQDPREELARWVTAKENPLFARSVVNRYWSYLFGRGLVESVDDLRATNPPSHPALMDALVKDFVDHNYDLKHLLRTLCRSRAYQLAAVVAPQEDADGLFITHHRPRQLPAEVLLDAVNQACGTVEAFEGLPPGTRAIALPDPAVASAFLEAFGRPKRTSTCECERGNRPDLSQALLLANGETLHRKVTDAKGRLTRLLASGAKDDGVVEELYLATFSRLPSARERETVRKLLSSAPSRKEGFEDLLWTLLNCNEFVVNH